MARRTLFRAAAAVAMATVLATTGVVALAPPLSAAAASAPPAQALVAPAAVPPSEECEWYGTMSWTRRSYQYNTEYDWSDRQYEKRTWTSEPVPGHECGATWTELFTLDYVDNDPGQDCTRVYTRTDRAEASGTGYTAIGILQGTPEYPYYLSAYAYADQPFTVSSEGTILGCGDNLASTSSYSRDANIGVGCTGQPGNVIPVESADVQSVNYTCTMPFEDTNDSGTVTTVVEEFVVDVRRNGCDPVVDSDADGLTDCEELDETGTDPNNPDTDGDGFIDGSDECGLEPGTVAGCPNEDQDGDGVLDEDDNCPSTANGNQSNLDGDSEGDACDSDVDGDGLSNDTETTAGTSPTSGDSDGDSISDSIETNGGQVVDTDLDGTVDGADPDADGDGAPDSEEGTDDSDGDGKPDWRDPSMTYTVQVAPAYTFNGNMGTAQGADSVRVSGFGASLVQRVCFESTWTAEVKRPQSSVAVVWNGGPIAGLEERTSTPGDGVNDGYRTASGFAKVTEFVELGYCATPTSAGNGIYTFRYPLELRIGSLGGILTEIEHSMTATLWTSAGQQGSVTLGTSDSEGTKLKIKWTESRKKPVSMDIAG